MKSRGLRHPDSANVVVALIDSDDDRRVLGGIANTNGWQLVFAETAPEVQRADIILCDRDLPGTDWRTNVSALHRAAPESRIILISSVNDEYLWNEVIRHGGFDVVKKPLQEAQVISAIRFALSYVQQRPATK